MPIRQIMVGASRTINLGNFQSLRIEASVTYEVDDDAPGDPYAIAEDVAQAELRKLLEQTYRNMTKKDGEPHAA